ncbi:MAG: PSD1 domain-containing protein [Verrucomicrobiales bacterium]|nr:PSD1 domain-containing protein [Verrucomicrobiales bacterium]
MTPLLLPCLLAGPASAAPDRAALDFFEKQIRPILANRCFECHSKTKQKGGLRVDHIGYLTNGGETGPALVPGHPEKSPMLEAVRYANADFQMPPPNNGGKIPDSEIALLEKWIQMGAPWPEAAEGKIVVTPGGFTEEQHAYWAFQPVKDAKPPKVQGDWARNDIDRFVQARLEAQQLQPAPEADRHELARRLYFDLHGLPPTREQIDAFVNDPDPKAYEKLVDQLLASPRYGERWAQHWLDLVRYAESDGYNADGYRPNVWPYRDYVIRSFNEDKPYDQFVREQLAGDEIAPDDPDVLIATAFLRHPVYEWNQRDVRGQWDIILTDMTDTAGEVFLGMSVGCAHCHNHKFDPILQKDYYRLRAFFAPVKWRDDLVLATAEEKADYEARQTKWEAATADIRAKMDALTGPLVEPRVERLLARFTGDLQAMVRKPKTDREALEDQLAGLTERQLQHERRTFDPMKSLKSDKDKEQYRALEAELKKFDAIKPAPLQEAFVATDAGTEAPAVSIKTRKGEQEIPPGFLSILDTQEPQITPTATSTGRRRVLAEWITQPDHPLSTRVIVNRVWQHHFGRGIVATPNDFGTLGEPPTHPELLDFLTRRFLTGGWHLKPLHRDILLSASYRQTARREPDATIQRVDPGNQLLWRFPPRRLDAEQVRDALLAVSGELDAATGGPASEGSGTRRSIYVKKKRNNPDELLRALDAPAGFASTPDRQSTTTPTQALQLINGDWLLARARRLATQVQTVDDAWIATLGRPPSAEERQVAESFLAKRLGGQSLADATPRADQSGTGFKENTPHERLVAQSGEREGDEFTIEAIARLDSIDTAASVRTLVSRWSLGKDSQEAFGWSLGVTGVKSRYTPRNLIIQVVGEDENANIGYQVVPSGIHIELGHRYHIIARLSCVGRNVTFTVTDLDQPKAQPESTVIPMDIRAKISTGASPLVIGGLGKRSPSHQWDGQIDGVRLFRGQPDAKTFNADPEAWNGGLLTWRGADPLASQFAWSGSDNQTVEPNDPRQQALNDLCQVLLNTNEFFYLH